MLKILFFAQLRENLDQDKIVLPYSHLTSTVDKLTNELIRLHPKWSSMLNSQILNNSSILIAVNQAMVDKHHTLNDGDEIAYFPPVTGG